MVCLLSKVSAQTIANNQTIGEDDWSLPTYVTATPNAGFINSFDLVAISWKQLNPSDGVYDWSILDQLTNASNPFWIQTYFSDSMFIPDWVINKYNLQSYDLGDFYDDGTGAPGSYVTNFFDTNNPGGIRSPGKFIPIWNQNLQAELKKL
jgi:hypothetical protein